MILHSQRSKKAMSLAHSSNAHTITVSDLTDQDTVLRVLSEIQSRGTSYSLLQNGVEVAKFVPVAERNDKDDKVSDELTKKRMAVFERMKAFSKEVAQLWSTDETAVEAITNDREASDRRLFHGSR